MTEDLRDEQPHRDGYVSARGASHLMDAAFVMGCWVGLLVGAALVSLVWWIYERSR